MSALISLPMSLQANCLRPGTGHKWSYRTRYILVARYFRENRRRFWHFVPEEAPDSARADETTQMNRTEQMAVLGPLRSRILDCLGGNSRWAPGYWDPPLGDHPKAAKG